eukprot:178206-Prymnesium_polylepis.1
MAKFTRLVWSLDWETSLRQLMTQPVAQQAFGQWVQQNSQADLVQLQLLVSAAMLEQLPKEQIGPAAMQVYQQLAGKPAASAEEATTTVRTHASNAEQMLAAEVFPKFVQSKAVSARPETSAGRAALAA